MVSGFRISSRFVRGQSSRETDAWRGLETIEVLQILSRWRKLGYGSEPMVNLDFAEARAFYRCVPLGKHQLSLA